MTLSILYLIVLLSALLLCTMIFMTYFIVHQQAIALIERFGKFKRIAHPGLAFKIRFIESISGVVNLRLTQMDVEVETKTQDNVFVNVLISVQYRVLPNKVYEAFYTFDNPESQIRAYVFDVVRARIPHIVLDDVFSKKDEVAIAVQEELKEVMEHFGYDILKALVTDIHPDARVKAAMNEINEAQRLRHASMERGEAEKILKIKQAEAESESKILQGQGLAGQRKAILKGMQEAFADFHQDIPYASSSEIINLMILSQYFDTLKEIGHSGKTNTIFLPHTPEGLEQFQAQLRNAVMTANAVSPEKTSPMI